MAQKPAIFWSAAFDEQTGQAIVTSRVFAFQDLRWLTCVYKKGGGIAALATYAMTVCTMLYYVATHRRAPIYAVVSRSDVGFLRDVPVLVMGMLGRNVICHFHGSDALILLTESRFRRLARALYRHCTLIVPSAHLSGPMSQMIGKEVLVCENPAALNADVPADNLSTPHATVPVLIWNSNMLASKGFADTLNAVGQINAIAHKLDFWALGSPLSDHEMSRDAISALVTQNTDKPWFHLIGPVSADQSARLTAQADIVALPSRYRSECQPLSIIQAMCLGKAIVASTTPAMTATLKDYPAFFVQDQTIAELQKIILDAVSAVTTNQYDAAHAAPFAQTARLRFSNDRFDTQMSDILASVTREDRS
jgi:glycosyltransferase involved in cell wall biosynthesis